MTVFIHSRTQARPYALMHQCPYVSVYDAGRQVRTHARTHTRTHVYMRMHAFFVYASVMHVFACSYMYVRTSCAPANIYQSPVHARAHSDQDLYRSQKIYGSFCNLSHVTCHMKRVPSHMRTTKVQNSLRVRSLCSGFIALWSIFLA